MDCCGGTLSLAGNVLGAVIACWIAGTFGERWRDPVARLPALGRSRDLLERRGAWIVFLLRVNPFTSSDLVSYAAGVAGVRPLQVGLGTLFGMAPLCYAQSYLAQSLFEWLSGRVLLAIGIGLLTILMVILLVRRRSIAGTPVYAFATARTGSWVAWRRAGAARKRWNGRWQSCFRRKLRKRL